MVEVADRSAYTKVGTSREPLPSLSSLSLALSLP